MTHIKYLFETIILLQHLVELNKMDDIDIYYIDLFCGAGGTSSGIELAAIKEKKVAKIIACVNHDKNAIASHMANHPYALHFTEDMRTLDLLPIVNLVKKIRFRNPNAKIVLWASLECTNFSKAKGGQARNADSRTLAEHLFRYIDDINPDLIQIENVGKDRGHLPYCHNHNLSTDSSKGQEPCYKPRRASPRFWFYR